MISKEQFLKYTKQLDNINARRDEKNEALKVLFPGTEPWVEDNGEIDLIVDLMNSIMPEAVYEDSLFGYSSDIEWYIYEKEQDEPLEGTVHSLVFKINDWSDLYDLVAFAHYNKTAASTTPGKCCCGCCQESEKEETAEKPEETACGENSGKESEPAKDQPVTEENLDNIEKWIGLARKLAEMCDDLNKF